MHMATFPRPHSIEAPTHLDLPVQEKGVLLRNIEVDHRGRLDETYIDTEEADEYCANLQKWYAEKIEAVEAMKKRKRR